MSGYRPYILLLGALIALPSLAHHSSAIYDKDRAILFDGTVIEFEWSNPHVFIHVEGEADGMPSRVWQFETSNPSLMRARGWTPDMLETGDRITIGGNPGRNKSRGIALLTSLAKDNIDLLNTGEPESARQETTDSLSGKWVVDPDNGLYEKLRPWNLELTSKGRQAVDTFDERTMLPQLRCIPSIAPSYMFVPDLKVITIEGDQVRFLSEYQGVERIFHLDADSHEGVTPSLHGHAIASLEDNRLVVETTRFADNRNGHQNGLASGSEKKLLEEFILSYDRRSMTYRFSLEDPEYFFGKVEGEARYFFSPGREYLPDECSIDNAQRLMEE